MEEWLKTKPIAFLKFGEKKHLESLQKGKFYTRNFGYYKDLEIKTKQKGMGDRHEASFVLNELDIKMYDNSNGKLVYQGPVKRSIFEYPEDSKMPVFCIGTLGLDNLNIIEDTDEYVKAETFFTDKQKQEFKEHFGEYVLIIGVDSFMDNIKTSFEKSGVIWESRMVKYSDYSINYMDRVEAFNNDKNGIYFYKDIYFQNQKEFRIVIYNRDMKLELETDINDMTSYSMIISADDLFNYGINILLNYK